MIQRLTGLIAATVTPMKSDGAVDLERIGPMIEWLIDAGVGGLYVCGSTGEGVSLTSRDRKSIVQASVEAVGKRIPVIVQVGHNCLDEAKELASHAQGVGADVVSATCPSYFKIGDETTLGQCMQRIACGAPELPFYYYHIPSLTGSTVSAVEFLKRAGDQIPNLAGMKYTSTLVHEYQSCLAVDDGRFDILWGCDEMLLSALVVGAKGAVGSTYNIASAHYGSMIDAWNRGDIDLAKTGQRQSVEMVNVMLSYPFQSALKAIMGMLGMDVGDSRLPLASIDDSQRIELQNRLDAIGFFQWCGH